ncbi:G5 and 3D domain-containing protein [Salimicrobium halophilum]|uniref:G5 and 3D domain-containing protein n=1 Tax=Salimicrobium halophilum TaxID=86666 RepID=UPI00159FBC49|nr:G5 and 3D domain-containing protein [Salimicrobium halophilum]
MKSIFTSKLLWMSVVSTVTIAFISIVVFHSTKTSVQVSANGEKELVRTHADTVAELLNELNIETGDHDELSHSLSDSVEYGMDIEYNQAKAVQVADGESTREVYTTASTVGELMKEEGIDMKDHDELSHKSSASVENDMTISIDRAFQVTVKDGTQKEKVWTTASTVDELLKEESISLDGDDRLKPKATASLDPSTPVTITRVERVVKTKEEEMEYPTVTKQDGNLLEGKEKVVSAGSPGIVEREYQITKINGKIEHRVIVGETVKKESQDRVVAVGTKEPKRQTAVAAATTTNNSSSASSSSASSSASSSSASRTLQMEATAYTADCAGCSGITATGVNLNANPNKKVVAVDPSVIPLGSRVWVEGYGTAVAADTGGAINGNRIDLHVPNKGEAFSFGRRSVEVKILD